MPHFFFSFWLNRRWLKMHTFIAQHHKHLHRLYLNLVLQHLCHQGVVEKVKVGQIWACSSFTDERRKIACSHVTRRHDKNTSMIEVECTDWLSCLCVAVKASNWQNILFVLWNWHWYWFIEEGSIVSLGAERFVHRLVCCGALKVHQKLMSNVFLFKLLFYCESIFVHFIPIPKIVYSKIVYILTLYLKTLAWDTFPVGAWKLQNVCLLLNFKLQICFWLLIAYFILTIIHFLLLTCCRGLEPVPTA